jgi:putative flippase GtrA
VSLISSSSSHALFIRYVVSGLTATGANLACFGLARLIAPFTLAVFLGAIAGVVTSMVLTSIFVFRTGKILPQGTRMLRFLSVHSLVVLTISLVSELVHFIVYRYNIPFAQTELLWLKGGDAMAFVAGVAIATPVGFLLHRHFTYSQNKTQPAG